MTDRICESDYFEWCLVCDEYVFDGDCRHLFWVSEYGFMGSGKVGCELNDYDAIAGSLRAVAVKLGPLFTITLALALEAGLYSTGFSGPLIGRGWMTCRLGGRWLHESGAEAPLGHGYLCAEFGLGDVFTDGLTEAEEEAMSLGVNWIVSLWPSDTDEQAHRTACALAWATGELR